MGYRKDMLTE